MDNSIVPGKKKYSQAVTHSQNEQSSSKVHSTQVSEINKSVMQSLISEIKNCIIKTIREILSSKINLNNLTDVVNQQVEENFNLEEGNRGIVRGRPSSSDSEESEAGQVNVQSMEDQQSTVEQHGAHWNDDNNSFGSEVKKKRGGKKKKVKSISNNVRI